MHEVNFDGLIGPTHCYAALAYGNIASMSHKGWISSPKIAALQGLKKMKQLMDLGLYQGFFLPQERPLFPYMRTLGFSGTDEKILHKIIKEDPFLLYALSSSSSMWAANSATITPSQDSHDGRLQITVANLENRFHRSIEAEATYKMLQTVFKDERYFVIHPPLPSGGGLGDEGAANHTRFKNGVHLFVYGKSIFETDETERHFPPRQALEASQAVARCHQIAPSKVLFAKQNHTLIDLGFFHNDVISVGHENFFLYHEKAFEDTKRVVAALQKKGPLETLCVTDKMVPIDVALSSYLFNSQIVTRKDGAFVMLAPYECQNLDLSWLPFAEILYADVEQSMLNGGGPACLRLRIPMTEEEVQHADPRFFLTQERYEMLIEWVETHYRDQLTLEDLSDYKFVQEALSALDALTQLLGLGSYYAFQKT